MLESLVTRDSVIPKDFCVENENEYFSLLRSKNCGKALTNMAEYLLETEGNQGQTTVRKELERCRTLDFGSG